MNMDGRIDGGAMHSHVTVFEDRCTVVKTQRLAAGTHVLRIHGLSPLLSEERCQVRLRQGSRTWPVSFVVERSSDVAQAPQASDDSLQRVDRAQRNLELAQAEADAAQHMLTTLSGAWAARAWPQGALDASYADVMVDAVARAQLAGESCQSAQAALVEAEKQHHGAPPSQRHPIRSTTVVGQFAAVDDNTEVVLSYTLPCAAWRPRHEARLVQRGSAQEVEWSVDATVWQATNETWRGGGELSTLRPNSAHVLPRLQPDVLRLAPKAVRNQVVVAARDEERESAPGGGSGGGGGRGGRAQAGVDDGGEARRYDVSSWDIAGNGRGHRLSLGKRTLPCTLQWMCIPEQSLAVVAVAHLAHDGGAPLLAGPVLTHLGPTCTGTTWMPLVGGGKFDLSFGSDDGFAVSFVRSRVVQERVLQSSVTHYLQEVRIRSRAAGVRTITVGLRVPVSEIDKLKVLPSPQHSTIEWRADVEGWVRLPVELQPGTERSLQVAFSLDAPADVVLPVFW
jgi:hypothetical protein